MNLASISLPTVGKTAAITPTAHARAAGQPASAATPLPTTAHQAPKPTLAELQQAVAASNTVLAVKTSNELHFALEKGTGMTVVKLVNRQSGETVLQFPSEAMLQIARSIDQVTGAIIQRKA